MHAMRVMVRLWFPTESGNEGLRSGKVAKVFHQPGLPDPFPGRHVGVPETTKPTCSATTPPHHLEGKRVRIEPP
jgi:hypothetical protein